MFIVYTILIPLLILWLNYLASSKPFSFKKGVYLLVKSLPHLFGYVLFLYYMGKEFGWDVSSAMYSFTFFLIPISVIAILLGAFFWIRSRLRQS